MMVKNCDKTRQIKSKVLWKVLVDSFIYTLCEAETYAHTGFVEKTQSELKMLKYISRK